MPEIGGMFSTALSGGAQIGNQDGVAIGSTVPPEVSAGDVEGRVSDTAQLLFWIALGYLAIYVFHVVTF